MPVITISRGSFTGGKMLAECLADKLKIRCVDRDVIVEKAAAYGVGQQELVDALMKPPSFWDRFKHTKYTYLTLIQAALVQEVRGGGVVYHGNAGHLLLRGVSHVLRTRVIAPADFRLAMVQDRLRLGREDALAHIQKMDQDRRKWAQYLYGVDWNDPTLYDLVVNLESIDICEACEVIAAAGRQRCFQETPESQAAMEDLALASTVRASLVMAPPTAHLEVEVTAHGGRVRVRGRLNGRVQHEEVERVVRASPGVVDVELDVSEEADV